MADLTRRTVTALLTCLLARPALAQTKLLTIVVPFPPGGSTDAMARLLQAGLRERLGGTTVVVENKPGAAGSIGAAVVARSTPDGSSLLLTFDSHAVIPALLDNPAVDVENDLLPVLLA